MGATHDLLRDEVRARPKAALRILHMLKAQGWHIQISEDDLTRIAARRAQTVIVSSGPDLPEATVTLYRRIQLATR